MPFGKFLATASCAALLSVAALMPHPARAAFAEPTKVVELDLIHFFQKTSHTPEQTQQIADIMRAHAKQSEGPRQQLETLRSQIFDQLAGGGPVDEAQLNALARQAFALRAQIDATDIEKQVAIRSVLTPSQIAEAAEHDQRIMALDDQQNKVRPKTRFNAPAYWPTDFFGDSLGYTRGLTLTADQNSQMRAIMAANAPEIDAIDHQRWVIRNAIATQLWGGEPATASQLIPMQRQASDLKSRYDALRLNMTIQIRSLLTPDQLARSATLHQQLADLHAQEASLQEAARAVQ